jgi:hypothetical protein
MSERSIEEVVSDIDGLKPDSDGEPDEEKVEALVGEYFSSIHAPNHLDAWFRLYERFGEFDGHSFWSILHGIEAQPGSGSELVVASVRRKPSKVPVMMVNRLLNGGIREVSGTDLFELLQQVILNVQASDRNRQRATEYLERQRKRAEPITAPDGDKDR